MSTNKKINVLNCVPIDTSQTLNRKVTKCIIIISIDITRLQQITIIILYVSVQNILFRIFLSV